MLKYVERTFPTPIISIRLNQEPLLGLRHRLVDKAHPYVVTHLVPTITGEATREEAMDHNSKL